MTHSVVVRGHEDLPLLARFVQQGLKKSVAECHQLGANALTMSGLPSEEIGAVGGGHALAAAALGPGGGVPRLDPSAGVVCGEQALKHLATGSGTDGVADAVVLGEGLHLVEVVL